MCWPVHLVSLDSSLLKSITCLVSNIREIIHIKRFQHHNSHGNTAVLNDNHINSPSTIRYHGITMVHDSTIITISSWTDLRLNVTYEILKTRQRYRIIFISTACRIIVSVQMLQRWSRAWRGSTPEQRRTHLQHEARAIIGETRRSSADSKHSWGDAGGASDRVIHMPRACPPVRCCHAISARND